jgi:hypothetical protein
MDLRSQAQLSPGHGKAGKGTPLLNLTFAPVLEQLLRARIDRHDDQAYSATFAFLAEVRVGRFVSRLCDSRAGAAGARLRAASRCGT